MLCSYTVHNSTAHIVYILCSYTVHNSTVHMVHVYMLCSYIVHNSTVHMVYMLCSYTVHNSTAHMVYTCILCSYWRTMRWANAQYPWEPRKGLRPSWDARWTGTVSCSTETCCRSLLSVCRVDVFCCLWREEVRKGQGRGGECVCVCVILELILYINSMVVAMPTILFVLHQRYSAKYLLLCVIATKYLKS